MSGSGTRRAAAATLVAAVVLGACTSSSHEGHEGPLPGARQLLAHAALVMRHVGSLRFELRSDGDLGGLPVRSAEGVLTDEGAAQGTVSLEEGGALAEFEFVIAGSSYFVKGPTGGWQSLPSAIAANVYDPTRLLDPDRGVSTLLEQAHGGVTRGREDVDDRPSYRIAATLRGEDLASAVPVPPDAEVPAILWVDAGSGYLLQARVRVPAGAGGTTTVALRLSDFGEPTTIVTPT